MGGKVTVTSQLQVGMDGYLTHPPHVAVLSLLFFEEG